MLSASTNRLTLRAKNWPRRKADEQAHEDQAPSDKRRLAATRCYLQVSAAPQGPLLIQAKARSAPGLQ